MSGPEADSVFVLCEQYRAFPRADRVWEAVHRFSTQQCVPSCVVGERQPVVSLFATSAPPLGTSSNGPLRHLLCAPSALPPCLVRVAPADGDADAVPLPPAGPPPPLRFGPHTKLVTLYSDYSVTVVCDLQPSIGVLDPATMTTRFDQMLAVLEQTVVALSGPCSFTLSGVTWRVSTHHTHTRTRTSTMHTHTRCWWSANSSVPGSC